MTAMISAAVAYLALKLGQGIESAIPIAILAIGFTADFLALHLRLGRTTLASGRVTVVTETCCPGPGGSERVRTPGMGCAAGTKAGPGLADEGEGERQSG